MLPTFASPWLLWGLISVGVLAVIYLLRMRSRRLIVSSLLLWIDQRTTDTGGRVWQKLRTPLAFFVELLALLLLVLAAANPLWPREGTVPIVVVLDNSYSMQAAHSVKTSGEAARTSKDLAQAKLASMLEDESLSAQVVLAGRRPVLLSERFNSAKSLEKLAPYWECLDTTADLGSAITLARQVGGLGARVLVVSDQVGLEEKEEEEKVEEKEALAPSPATGGDPGNRSQATGLTSKKPETKKPETKEPTLDDQVRWIAVGRPLPNLAIVSAVRRDAVNKKDQGRAIVEVVNFSTESTTCEMAVQLGDVHSARPLDIKPGEIRRFTIPMTDNRAKLELMLPPDALALDNHATLLPESVAKIRVNLSISDKKLREALQRALQATGRVELTDVGPQLRFSDSVLKPREGCWDVSFLADKESRSILGPFVLEKTNELLEGITLDGIVLCQSEKLTMPGRPLVASDTATLVSLDVLPDERERLFLQYGPDKTTLLGSLDFPILVWNLLRWREGGLPEQCRSNVRLGEPICLRLKKDRKNVEQIASAGKPIPLTIVGDATIFSCNLPGKHEIVLDKGAENEHRLSLSANVLFRDESDLRDHRAGEWGKWTITDETRHDYLSIIVPLLLAALLLWVLHGRMVRSSET